jgi:UDP-GlcNAc:undecaprenyl-phosphate GlcNAc-1-phosphate transferase
LDTTLAVLRRFLRNRSIFAADRGHIHHKLLDMGWTPRRAALVLYGLCGLTAALSLLYDAVDNSFNGLIIVLFCGVAWLGVQHLGYAEFGMASRLLLRGQLRGMIDAQVRLQAFERELRATEGPEELWQALEKGCTEFDLVGVRTRLPSLERQSRGLPEHASDCWQLRLPFDSGYYVNLYRDPDRAMHPVVFSHFADIITRTVREVISGGVYRFEPVARRTSETQRGDSFGASVASGD